MLCCSSLICERLVQRRVLTSTNWNSVHLLPCVWCITMK